MRCKNCGADYPMRELRCPYCGQANPKGLFQKMQREQAETDYQRANTTVGQMRRRMANRIMNRILIAEVALLILIVGGAFIYSFAAYFIQEAKINANSDSIQAHMEELYTQGRFNELDYYMERNHLPLSAYPEYFDATMIQFYYNQFNEERINYLTKREELPPYTARSLVSNMNYLLSHCISDYPDLTERNQKLADAACREVEVFASVILGFDDSQIELLKQSMLTSETADQLADLIMQECVNNGT